MAYADNRYRELTEDLKRAADNLYIVQLTNTHYDTFLYRTRDFKEGYNQDKARVGDTFYDGNNGDKHKVLYVNRKGKRMVVVNKTQHPDSPELWYWTESFEHNPDWELRRRITKNELERIDRWEARVNEAKNASGAGA
jgi:hypothetical protein